MGRLDSRPLMPTRTIALLLAFALLWSGVASHTPAVAPPGMTEPLAPLAAALAEMVHPGDAMLTDHPLGDGPAQPLIEMQADAQALLAGNENAALSMLSLPRPIRGMAAAMPPPFLAGLQRPPCSALHSA